MTSLGKERTGLFQVIFDEEDDGFLNYSSIAQTRKVTVGSGRNVNGSATFLSRSHFRGFEISFEASWKVRGRLVP